jgi:hypothetical protein
MKLIISIFCLFLVSISFAQRDISISLTAAKNNIEIGEPLTIKLTIDFPANSSNQKIVLPIVTDSAKLGKGIEIWETNTPVDTLIENNRGEFIKHIEQSFTIASFDTGAIDINPLKAIFGTDTLYTNVISLTISAAPLEENAKLKNNKPIKEDPFTIEEELMIWLKANWLIILIVLLVPIILLVIFFILKNRPEKLILKEAIPLNVRSLDRLAEIEEAQIWKKGEFKQYHSDITSVIWMYLSERYQIATFEKTSDEILKQLKFKAVSNDQFIQLQKLMEMADLVKFAKTIPTQTDNESALVIAKEFIHTTYESQQKTTNK